MKINAGTKNPAKLDAIKETLSGYQQCQPLSIVGMNVSSGVSEQPTSLDETILGAKNRARAAYDACDWSIGIESGLMKVPHTRSGYMDVCACVIYNGKDFAIGLSSAWDCPPEVIKKVQQGKDLNAAFHELGFTQDKKIGSSQGAIGILTGGKVDRKLYTAQAIVMAMIVLENEQHY